MSIVLGTNISALMVQNNLTSDTLSLNNILQELSTGHQINGPADDSSGLTIANNLQAQINGANQAASNAANGNNLLGTVDSTLSNVQNDLQSIRTLAVEAANGDESTSNLSAIHSQIAGYVSAIKQMTKATQFNGKNLMQSGTATMLIQVGANNVSSTNTINITSALGSATATGLGVIFSANSLNTTSAAQTFLSTVDSALTAVGNRRATVGSYQNRLQDTISNLQITAENYQSSYSQIMDTNVASAAAALAQYQILQETAASVLTQANQTPALALELIRPV